MATKVAHQGRRFTITEAPNGGWIIEDSRHGFGCAPDMIGAYSTQPDMMTGLHNLTDFRKDIL